MRYFAKFSKEVGGGWSVTFPDCPGCQTCGDTLAEALKMAADALDGWLATHLQDGESPPRPKARKGRPIYVSTRVATAMALRWARDNHALSQGELARRVGVSQQQIAKLESPDANPTIATLEKVASALGVRLELVLSAA